MAPKETAKKGPLVSVCVPCCNAFRTIGATIRSVLASSHANLELIVSDDASTDNTQDVVEGFADPRVRFYPNKCNAGAPANWNRALQKARGEYVGLLNHDDLYGPFWLSFAVNVLEKHPEVGWVTSAYWVVDDAGRVLGFDSRFAEGGEIPEEAAFVRVAVSGALGPAYLARRGILEALAYYDEAMGVYADQDLHMRLAARYPLCYSVKPHAAWRVHPANLSHSLRPIDQFFARLKIFAKTFSDPSLPAELRPTREACYNDLYSWGSLLRREALRTGDADAAGRLTRLLAEHGYVE